MFLGISRPILLVSIDLGKKFPLLSMGTSLLVKISNFIEICYFWESGFDRKLNCNSRMQHNFEIRNLCMQKLVKRKQKLPLKDNDKLVICLLPCSHDFYNILISYLCLWINNAISISNF